MPNDKVGVIIGKQGMTIKGIQDRCGAMIQIPAQPDEDNPNVRTLSIGGDSKEAVDAAQMEITVALQQQALASQQVASQQGGGGGGGGMGQGGSGASSQYGFAPSQTAMLLPIPDDKVGVIIGKGGVTIKEIQNRSRVKITIPQSADPGSNPATRTCRWASCASASCFTYFLHYLFFLYFLYVLFIRIYCLFMSSISILFYFAYLFDLTTVLKSA